MRRDRLFDSKQNCCGCESCIDICPKGIISLTTDEEGFNYPEIIDNTKCIECNRCVDVCPIKNVDDLNSKFVNSYAGWSVNKDEVISSSSGGFASVIAKYALVNNYIVYGVAFSDDFYSAEYIRVNNFESLERLKTSKYITSNKNHVYQKVRNDLLSGLSVVFFGLPCDVYALLRYVGSSEKLFTVSLICHGPTSESLHKAYLKDIESRFNSKIKCFSLRYKKKGNWKPYYIHADFYNGCFFEEEFDYSNYDIAFQYFKRPSCHQCVFKENHFAADILIGDYHSAQKGQVTYNRSGVSSILPLTDKGITLINYIKDVFVLMPVDIKSSISQKAVHSAVESKIDRYEFINEFKNSGLVAACNLKSIKKQQANRTKNRRVMKIKVAIYSILHFFKLR